MTNQCSFEGCERPRRYIELCHAHYQQLKRGGELRPIRSYAHRPDSPKQRLATRRKQSLAAWREQSRDAVTHRLVDGMWLPV